MLATGNWVRKLVSFYLGSTTFAVGNEQVKIGNVCFLKELAFYKFYTTANGTFLSNRNAKINKCLRQLSGIF
jgi:hypothetical protein